jgi:tetratricopeptide (TPR) repeat protein
LDHFLVPEKSFWLNESPQGVSFGPYTNRSHYGGLMVMLFPVAFSMLLYKKPRISHEGFKERVRALLDHLSANLYLFLVLVVIVMGGAVFISLSRAGIVCLCFSLLFMGILMTNRKNIGRRRGIRVTVMAGVILLSVGWLGWEPVFARFDKFHERRTELAKERLLAWQDTAGIVKSYPIFGTGAGTSSHAHKAFRKTASENSFSEYVYNDYLDILAEQGIVGLGCFAAYVLAVFASVKQFRQRKKTYFIYLFCGSITGLVAILFFGLFEHQLQNGANAVYFFFLSGLCIAAAHTRMRSVQRPTFLKTNQRKWLEPVFGLVTVFLLFWGTVFYAPLESRNLIVSANAQSALTAKDNSALEMLDRAIRSNPMNSGNLQAAAQYFFSNGQFALAQKFYQAALKYEPTNSRIHGEHAYWLMEQGLLKEGVKEMQTAIALSPGRTKIFVDKMAQLNLSYDEMVASLPAMVRPFLELGEYLMEADQKKLALRAYQRAAENIAHEKVIQADWIQRLCRFYLEQEMLDDAFQVASIGIKHLPRDSSLRYAMGTIYEKMGVFYRATEEYELAIDLDPQNISARRGLERIKNSS